MFGEFYSLVVEGAIRVSFVMFEIGRYLILSAPVV